jgi:hypothetical protein
MTHTRYIMAGLQTAYREMDEEERSHRDASLNVDRSEKEQ